MAFSLSTPMPPTRDATLRGLPPCPKCGVDRGDPCRAPNGRTTKAHQERESYYNEELRVLHTNEGVVVEQTAKTVTETPSLPRKKRWKKLFDKLDSLPRKKFDFSTWGKDLDIIAGMKRPTLKKCSTVGCVGGWLPTFFPKSWQWSEEGPHMRGRVPGFPITDFSAFMKIPEDLARMLLVPNSYHETYPGIRTNVTPKQWVKEARRILKEQYKDVP